MHFRFHNGRSDTLRGVPERHYHGVLHASSAGWYFNAYLLGPLPTMRNVPVERYRSTYAQNDIP